MMKQEYTDTTSHKPSRISPYPFLAALSGQFINIANFVVKSLAIKHINRH